MLDKPKTRRTHSSRCMFGFTLQQNLFHYLADS